MDSDNDDNLDSDWGGPEDALLKDLVLSHDDSERSFKKRTRTTTFESFDSQNDDFLKAQLNMSNIVDEDDVSVTSDSEHRQFESLLATIPQLLKKKTESSVRFHVTKYINSVILEVSSNPSLRSKILQHDAHKLAVALIGEVTDQGRKNATSKIIEQIKQEEKAFIDSLVPDLESLALNHSESAEQNQHGKSPPVVPLPPSTTTKTDFHTTTTTTTTTIEPQKHHRLILPLRCIENLNIIQQRTFLSATTLLFKRSMLSIVDEGIPLLIKMMEAEFLTLSSTFDELEKYVFADLKGFSAEDQGRRVELSKILDYSHDAAYSDAQKKSLSLLLLNAEKKLKHRLKCVTEASKAYYEQVESRIAQLTRSCNRFPFFETEVIISPSVKKKLHAFDMTKVIDFIRDSDGSSRESPVVNEINTNDQQRHEKAVANHDLQKERLTASSKNFNKKISEFISARLRYEEAKKLSESTKKIFQEHLQKQIKGVHSLLNVLDEGDEIFNSDDDSEQSIEDDSLLTQVDRLDKKNRKPLKALVSMEKHVSIPKGSVQRFHREKYDKRQKPSKDFSETVNTVGRNLVHENRQVVGHWTDNHHKEDLRREHTVGLLTGLDLTGSTSRFALRAPLPNSILRPSSPDRLPTTELKTMMQKLGYIEFDFDRPVSPMSNKSKGGTIPKALVDNLKFHGKPSSKFALTSQMIEQYQFSPKRIKSHFKNLPINPEEKRKKMEQNRISDLTLSENNQKAPLKSISPLKAHESDTSLQLDEFLLGKRKHSPERKDRRKSPTKSLSNSMSILQDLAEDKLSPVKNISKLDAHTSKACKMSKSTDHLLDESCIGVLGGFKTNISSPIPSACDTGVQQRQCKTNKNPPIAEPKFPLPQDVLDAFHEPVVWNGDDEVNSLMIQKVMSHQMLDLQDNHQVYYQGSLEPIDIGSLLDFRMKMTALFEEIGLIDEVDDESVGENENDILTMKIEHAFHNLQTIIEDDRLINDDWNSLAEETESLCAQVVSLVSKLKSVLNEEFLKPFVMGLHHSKLIRKEAELELLESFVKRSLDSSRLQSMGILAIPVDYFGSSMLRGNDVDMNQKDLKLNVVKYAQETSFHDLHSALDKIPCPTIPFRMGKDKEFSAKNRRSHESLLAAKPRTMIEQQIDHSFYTLSQLRRHLRTSLLNLLEMICANTLFPMVFILNTETKCIKVKEYLQGLQESIALHAPFTGSLDDLNMSCLMDHEVFSDCFSTQIFKYDIDDYNITKELVKSKIIQHATFQLNDLTEELLMEARETSALIGPPLTL